MVRVEKTLFDSGAAISSHVIAKSEPLKNQKKTGVLIVDDSICERNRRTIPK